MTLPVLVSIIVPVYNVELFLNRCIDSLINQTYENIEIILIDDGSTDSSGKMCDGFKNESPVIQVIHKENNGLGMARNTGIIASNGKYLMFVDSDDYIDLEAVATLVGVAEENNADIVTSQFIFDNETEATSIKKGMYFGSQIKNSLIGRMFGNSSSVQDQINVSSCTKIYKKSIIDNNNLEFPSERKLIWEDLVFNLYSFSVSTRVYVMDYAYYHYCYNSFSLTHKYNPEMFDKLAYMYDFLNSELEELSQDAQNRMKSMFLGNIRTCIKIEALYARTNGVLVAYKNIRRIVNSKQVQELVEKSNNIYSNRSQRIFNIFLKMRSTSVIYLLSNLQNKKKNNLID